jgi:hypothetical protein
MPKHRVSLFGRGLLVAAAIAGSAQAQEAGVLRELKLRTAWSPEAKDNLRQSSLGVGLNFGFATAVGTVGVELGYYYKTGDIYIEPVTGAPPAGLDPVDAANSGDSRRNQLDGFSVRLSFARPINPGWSWQAGLMIGGTRFKHEYFGDVRGENWVNTNATSWRDTYSGTPTEGGFKVSPYAGLSWKITKHSSVEFNVMALSYTALNYGHRPGSGVYALDTDPESDPSVGRIAPHNAFPGDTLTKTNRFVPHLEFGYVFHF